MEIHSIVHHVVIARRSLYSPSYWDIYRTLKIASFDVGEHSFLMNCIDNMLSNLYNLQVYKLRLQMVQDLALK